MTDMIERVRLALKASLDDSLRGAGVDPAGWHMTDAAKAAIAAMREPTETMIAALDGQLLDEVAWGDLARGFRAAIDAALGDKP